MKILTAEQIREADQNTLIRQSITSGELMERAGKRCFGLLIRRYPDPRPVAVFPGKGNNGGDGMVIARLLANARYPVSVYLPELPEQLSPEALIQYKKLREMPSGLIDLHSLSGEFPSLTPKTLIIDALLGTGIHQPVQGLYGKIIQGINQSGKEVVSIDIPSGLPCSPEDFDLSGEIVRARLTLTLQQPKLTLLLADFHQYVGDLEWVDIDLDTEDIPEEKIPYFFSTRKEISPLLKPRDTFSHKGHYGHALLIAGSYGKMGAAVLSAEACLRTGAGLLSVHAPQSGRLILQTKVPEAMCTSCLQTFHIAGLPDLTPYQAAGIGPGIGTAPETGKTLVRLLQKAKVPLVLDADAINLLGQNPDWISLLPPETILTPHPKEFERLTGPSSSSADRLSRQRQFSIQHKVILVLKGAYSSISFPDGKIHFNSTGNPGMATAGSGDVLTGIILSLLTQGYSQPQAALTGVFLHGLSGDLAAATMGQEALLARDLIGHIKNAMILVKQP